MKRITVSNQFPIPTSSEQQVSAIWLCMETGINSFSLEHLANMIQNGCRYILLSGHESTSIEDTVDDYIVDNCTSLVLTSVSESSFVQTFDEFIFMEDVGNDKISKWFIVLSGFNKNEYERACTQILSISKDYASQDILLEFN